MIKDITNLDFETDKIHIICKKPAFFFRIKTKENEQAQNLSIQFKTTSYECLINYQVKKLLKIFF